MGTTCTRWPASPIDSWSGVSLPLAKLNRLRTTDLDAVHAHMSVMLNPHKLNIEGGAPPIAFLHNQASLRSLTFNAIDYGNPFGRVVVTIPPMKDVYLVQISLGGHAKIIQGKDSFVLGPGEMCVLDSDSGVREEFREGYKHFTIRVPKLELEMLLTEELGFRPGRLKFIARAVPLTGKAASFAQMVRTVCEDIENGDTAYSHPRACSSIEGVIERLLLLAAPHNHSELFDGCSGAPAPFYVRRVEDYIRANAENAICLMDLIEVAGVSARSLHTGFRHFRDTTPMTYLKNYRLALAREALKKAVRQDRSVTEIALACGFTHLSKFARDYAECYGQKPSETLRNSRLSGLRASTRSAPSLLPPPRPDRHAAECCTAHPSVHRS